VRAILVSTSLDPFHIASVSLLRGSVTMCGRDGKSINYAFTTNRISNAGMSLILFNDTQSQFGNLDATLDGGVLAANYHGFEPQVQGNLRRGSRQDVEQACANLNASPATGAIARSVLKPEAGAHCAWGDHFVVGIPF
jgi:hypothetical protein